MRFLAGSSAQVLLTSTELPWESQSDLPKGGRSDVAASFAPAFGRSSIFSVVAGQMVGTAG